jgi:hypothetical protein
VRKKTLRLTLYGMQEKYSRNGETNAAYFLLYGLAIRL